MSEPRIHNHGLEEGPGSSCHESLAGDCVQDEWETLRKKAQVFEAYIQADIALSLHRATCLTCEIGDECEEEYELWSARDELRDAAWELVRPGITSLRVDAFTGQLIGDSSQAESMLSEARVSPNSVLKPCSSGSRREGLKW